MRNVILAGLSLAFIASTAVAQNEESPWEAPPPEWEGTWQGTIDKLPVHVCLNNTPFENRGAYYYDQYKSLLSLDLDEHGKWVEGEGRDNHGPRWDLENKSADELVGTWSNGQKTLPVRLHRIGGSSQEYEGPCSRIEFHRARLAPVQFTSKRGVQHGAPFITWTFNPGRWFKSVEISTFTLDRPGANVTKVNALLRAVLPKADGSGEWLDCMAGNANAHGSDGEYWESIAPTLVSARWLSAAHRTEYFCGGMHPENISHLRTFDLDAGVEVDPHDWFKPSAVRVERYEPGDEPGKMLTPAFIDMITKGWKAQDEDCANAVGSEEFWNIGIARGALVFSPDLPRVVMACGEDIKIPFARLQPWLNAKGKAMVATLPR